MDHNITVTDNVFRRVRILAEKSDNIALKLRVKVTGGGCSGFSYNYSMTEEVTENDICISKDDISIVIDKDSINFLESCKIDFIEELGNSYFSITNPNATAKCGCGNSFSI
jgi:iron-sulfur cluster insertion protein